ncbi:MAG: 50S ribosomal protein L32e [Thermofilum sp. ex4484_79]|nr:MAG: 50S ribosomal protein L32e [Thermofilum sp. ex4484_79]
MNRNLSKELVNLLKLRRELKSKKPRFIVMNVWSKPRLPDGWRRPKGLDNKIRLEIKGFPKRVKVGYRGPRKVRNLHPSGYIDVLVNNIKELEVLDPKIHAIRIARTVGRRKREEIIKRAEELGFKILNPERE